MDKGRTALPAPPAHPALFAFLRLCPRCPWCCLRRYKGRLRHPVGPRSHRSARPPARRPLRVPPGDSAGVHAYVIDTGVRRTHHEFDGRVEWVGDFTTGTGDRPGRQRRRLRSTAVADRGYGTHVASVLAGRTFGVARAARVHALTHPAVYRHHPYRFHGRGPCRRLDHRARFEARGGQHQPRALRDRRPHAGRGDRSLDPGGVRVVLSAGGVANLDGYSPQRVTDAITVGSTDAADAARQSGYGPHLTIFAPGVRIQGAATPATRLRTRATAIPMPHRWSPVWRRSTCNDISRHSGGCEGRDPVDRHSGRRHACGHRSGAAAPRRQCRLVTPTYNFRACASPSRLWYS